MMVSLSLFYRCGSNPIYYLPLELEPRKLRNDEVDVFIDPEATREDHEEVRTLTSHGLFHTCVNFTVNMWTGNKMDVKTFQRFTEVAGKRRKIDTGDAYDVCGRLDIHVDLLVI